MSGRAGQAAKAALNIATRAMALCVLLAVIGSITVLMILPRATQGAALTVLTGSMTPEIPVGSVVFVRPVDTATLQVGDVATYQVSPEQEIFITHRITDIADTPEGKQFTFQGDANPGPDKDPVEDQAIRGEVWFHVPYLGTVRDTLNGRAGLTLLAVLLLGTYALTQLWGAAKDRRTRDEQAESSRPGQLVSDQPLLVARVVRDAQSPQEVATSVGGVVLHQDSVSFVLLVVPSDGGFADALTKLEFLPAIEVQVVDAATEPLIVSSTYRPRTDSALTEVRAKQ